VPSSKQDCLPHLGMGVLRTLVVQQKPILPILLFRNEWLAEID
jgi:hypothetical protein